MISLSFLNLHSSSSVKIYENLNALAQRSDVYTGDDFYFGFDSSNQGFLDIIGGHRPLAIKYGPSFSLFQRDITGTRYEMYYIDVKNKCLLPIIRMSAKSQGLANIRQMLPFSFANFYTQSLKSSKSSDDEKDIEASSFEDDVHGVLEVLADNQWPSALQIEKMLAAIQAILSKDQHLSITVSDILALKAQMQTEIVKKACDEDFVADYYPFYDTARIDIDFLLERHKALITVREVNDKYPRIEVIIPDTNKEDEYQAVFKSKDADLYEQLRNARVDTKAMSALLKLHFHEKLEGFLSKQGISLTSASQAAP